MSDVKCFYLDEPLLPEEEALVLDALAARGALKDREKAQFEYRRVPSVLPVRNTTGVNLNDEVAHLTDLLRKHLRRAGIRSLRTQPLWLMPKETYWGVIFQLACYEETGFYPYVIQRWRPAEDGSLVRAEVRLIDGHGMMGFKDENG